MDKKTLRHIALSAAYICGFLSAMSNIANAITQQWVDDHICSEDAKQKYGRGGCSWLSEVSQVQDACSKIVGQTEA